MFRQIETFPKDPIYILVAPIKKKITKGEKTRIIVDVGFDLEVDISGKKFERERELLEEGDWVFILGKMFSEIVDEKKKVIKVGTDSYQNSETVKKEESKKVGLISKVMRFST